MRDKEKNRDPERAIKRATADLRCAVRKLGVSAALRVFAEFVPSTLRDPPQLECRAQLLVMAQSIEDEQHSEGAA